MVAALVQEFILRQSMLTVRRRVCSLSRAVMQV
jgi:hypothetical protein